MIRSLRLVLVLALMGLLAACLPGSGSGGEPATTPPSGQAPTQPSGGQETPAARFTISPSARGTSAARVVTPISGGPRSARASQVEDALRGLTLEQKLGQLMMVTFEGTDLGPASSAQLQQRHIGNVVLLGGNIQSPEQLARLTDQIKAKTRATTNGIDPILAVDQEGGQVRRLRAAGFESATLPEAALMGLGTAENTELWGAATGRDLQRAGMSMDLAPVFDVNDNPANPVIAGYGRAFATTPEAVSRHALAFMQGLQGERVMSVAKHFPGHGSTWVDSHVALPHVTKSLAQLNAVELPPFRDAIAAGVDAVMVAHIVYDAWDAERPSSLSPRVVTGLLRGELGFDGVVMTDDLTMDAISATYGPGEAAVLAIEAGVDMLVTVAGPSSLAVMLDSLASAVRTGRLSEERIDQSVRRILILKNRYGLATG